MNLGVFSPAFLEDVRQLVDRYENMEWDYKLRAYVRKRENDGKESPYVRIIRIMDFEDYTYYGGYCETCSYEEAHCKITYETDHGVREYDYYGSFAELINDLVSDD